MAKKQINSKLTQRLARQIWRDLDRLFLVVTDESVKQEYEWLSPMLWNTFLYKKSFRNPLQIPIVKPNHALYHFYFCLANLMFFFETKGGTK